VPAAQLVTGAVVAPLAPAAGLGAGALITVLAWLICFTLAYIWRRSFGAMLQWLADEIDRVRLPTIAGGGHVFGAVSSAFRAADNAVEGALVYAANATEHAAVWLFHETAARFDQLGREIGGLAFDVSRWGSHLIHATIPHEIATRTRLLWHALRVAEARSTAAIRTEAHAWRAGVNKLTVAVEHEYDLLGRRIGRVGTRVGRLERTVEGEIGRLSRVEKLLGVAAFTGLVIRALDRLGLRWLRCPALGRIGRRIGCGGFGLLEDLLAASFTGLILTDVCEFAGAMTRLAEWYRPLLMDFVDAEDALIGCHGATKPPPLGLPRLYLPPVPDPLPLG
jgi:hypothetical protein